MTGELPVCEVTHGCITCGDVAVTLTVIEVRGADAWCCDRLLVHAGVALERLHPIEVQS
jgi:hypothetical protein